MTWTTAQLDPRRASSKLSHSSNQRTRAPTASMALYNDRASGFEE
ncbi:MAG TPA: hypothetical protein VF584_08025 [Longimicrobium sp.]